MARRRSYVPGSEVVPAELLSKADPVWRSEESTRRWLDAHGLEWHDRMQARPLNRHEYATHAWARANGFTRQIGGGFPSVDLKRLRDAGVPGSDGAEVSEWMRHMGMEGRR